MHPIAVSVFNVQALAGQFNQGAAVVNPVLTEDYGFEFRAVTLFRMVFVDEDIREGFLHIRRHEVELIRQREIPTHLAVDEIEGFEL